MKSRYEVRNPYTYDCKGASDETGLLCSDPSLTVQSEAVDADINTIVERFGLTGQLPQNVCMPVAEDYVDVVDSQMDFNTAMLFVKDSQAAFMQFPADVRARFGHNPQNMVSFMQDERNREEAERLGLVVAKQPPQAAPAGAPEPSAPAASPSVEG